MPIKPRILQRGDTVGIVALGSPVARSIIDASIAFLQGMGLQVVLGKYVYAQNGFLAGTAQQRAEDLMSMFTNTQVKMILPVRGGVGVKSILPFLDYTVIAQNPKIVSGYSDITVLLNILNQFTDLITFHSLLLIDFRPQTPAYNFEQFFTITSSTVSPRPILNPTGVPLTGRVQGNVSGPVVGGNLTSIVSTLGTPYEINTAGKILLLEETHEPINTVYRYIDHMRMAGKFEDCLGIIMGECTDCPNAYGKSYNDLISEFIVPLGKPLMTNLASGHGFYKSAIPIGARVNLNTSNNTITLLEAAVS
ncbi:LD-carboxypeptidase [Domibacillus sp. PGB-M46]|uniref:S66 peptidase family protein n=1 Tax=Domibacillus sp. PGB-M46 TaxID=2910255 RepID=UPI001F58F615|nr:LD-carboxypeptidase [Domibacillus sp. PGB-M46]MCI2256566.1 LD-carboxypeptidase [Domibacillus sp. PGB-M46]